MSAENTAAPKEMPKGAASTAAKVEAVKERLEAQLRELHIRVRTPPPKT